MFVFRVPLLKSASALSEALCICTSQKEKKHLKKWNLSMTRASNVLLVNKCLIQFPCSRKKAWSGRLQNNMTGNYWNQWDLHTNSSIPNGLQVLTCLNSWLYFPCIGVYKCSYSKWPLQLLHYCVVKLWTDVFYCVISNLLCCTTIVLTQRKLICRLCITSHYGFMYQHPTLQIFSYKFKGQTANISYKYFFLFLIPTVIKKLSL